VKQENMVKSPVGPRPKTDWLLARANENLSNPTIKEPSGPSGMETSERIPATGGHNQAMSTWIYEVASIISGTGAAICTTVVAAQCNGTW
jgi:hypothetical protein